MHNANAIVSLCSVSIPTHPFTAWPHMARYIHTHSTHHTTHIALLAKFSRKNPNHDPLVLGMSVDYFSNIHRHPTQPNAILKFLCSFMRSHDRERTSYHDQRLLNKKRKNRKMKTKKPVRRYVVDVCSRYSSLRSLPLYHRLHFSYSPFSFLFFSLLLLTSILFSCVCIHHIRTRRVFTRAHFQFKFIFSAVEL